MRVLVCGDRHWSHVEPIYTLLQGMYSDRDVLIHGDAEGADRIAAVCAMALGIPIDQPPSPTSWFGGYPAEWKILGRAAGPIRNQQMLDQGLPEIVYAFHDDISRSKGTADMIGRAVGAGLQVWLVNSAGERRPISKLVSKNY